MRIEDRAQRDALELAADRQGWNSRQLEQRVRPLLLAQKTATMAEVTSPTSLGRLLTPKRGTVEGAGGFQVKLPAVRAKGFSGSPPSCGRVWI